jgi:hypothetical protein
LPNSYEETFLLPDGFLTTLDPQVRLLTLPNFGVNTANCTDEQYKELLEQMAPIAEQVSEKLNLQ